MSMGLRDDVERKCIVYGRIAALDAVDELKAYKEKNGHLNVRSKDDASLHYFCTNVRQARKGKASYRLDTTRISALNSIGLDWNTRVNFHTKQNYNQPLQQDHDVEGLQPLDKIVLLFIKLIIWRDRTPQVFRTKSRQSESKAEHRLLRSS